MSLHEAQSREHAPLAHLCLPEDLFDRVDPEQTAIDAGDYADEVGVWRGGPTVEEIARMQRRHGA